MKKTFNVGDTVEFALDGSHEGQGTVFSIYSNGRYNITLTTPVKEFKVGDNILVDENELVWNMNTNEKLTNLRELQLQLEEIEIEFSSKVYRYINEFHSSSRGGYIVKKLKVNQFSDICHVKAEHSYDNEILHLDLSFEYFNDPNQYITNEKVKKRNAEKLALVKQNSEEYQQYLKLKSKFEVSK